MTITLSQQDYWDLVDASQCDSQSDATASFDRFVSYPAQLGQGYYHFIDLCEGLELLIGHFQLHDDLVIVSPERSHPIEYAFYLAGKSHRPQSMATGKYCLYGSGTAPKETWGDLADEPILEVNIHFEPSVFRTFLGESGALNSTGLTHLMQPAEQLYYERFGTTTVVMQTALHQLLHCPFEGITRKIYLESKVWELMALLIEQELLLHTGKRLPKLVKTDDIERIHQARDILAQQLNNPPSLIELARQVGLNDCTLKRGFRQVFGKTAFGYLHDYRMEQARRLLRAGELNVSEAARRVGFANRSYFAAAFRKKYGVSPSQMKKSG
ncbi:MAG: AraC family transcriptional regulator [Cyanobacteria bacterium P01_D01_bin.115]